MYVWELLRDAFTEIGSMRFGTESAGTSTVTLTDSSLSLTASGLVGGTAFILSAGGAAPEGEITKITANTTTALTVNAITTNIAIGDIWGFISKEFPIESLLPMVNIGLDYLGMIGVQDTSITTADNQTEYTFPVALKYGEVVAVYIQTNLNDANDNRWLPLRDWRVTPSTAGTTATLILPQLMSGYNVLVEYTGLHPDVTAYTDFIHESIHPDLAKAAFILALQNRRSEQAIGSQTSFNLLYNKAMDNFERVKGLHPIWLPDKKTRRLSIFGRSEQWRHRSEPNIVRL